MKFKEVLKEVEESKEFKDWHKKNSKSYVVAGFFTLNFEKMGKDKKPTLEQEQLDYLHGKKVSIFHISKENGKRKITITEEDANKQEKEAAKIVGKKVAKEQMKKVGAQGLEELKLPEKFKCDIEDLESQVRDEMSEKSMQNLLVTKIVAVLQMHDNKLIWNVTTIFSSLELLTMHIGVESGELFFSEKKNIFQVMKKI